MAGEVIDRREALEEAFEMAEADAKGEEYVAPVRETSEETDGGTGVVAEGNEEDPAIIEQKAAERSSKEKPRTRGVPSSERGKPTVIKDGSGTLVESTIQADAPVSWKPEEKALWAKIPADIRTVINRREKEISSGLNQAGQARKVAEEYMSVVQPFSQVIQEMNTTPREAIRNVMTTATALIKGNQRVKCDVLAEMIQSYGVDLIELDKTLTAIMEKNGGRLSSPQKDDPLNDPRVQARLKPLFDMQTKMQTQEQQHIQQLQTNAATEVEKISSKPHFNAVREDMADLMDIASKRGLLLTTEEAYTRACAMNPEVSKIVSQRQRGTSVSDAARTLARSRKAASTVTGAPASGGSKNSADGRRAALESAWDEQG